MQERVANTNKEAQRCFELAVEALDKKACDEAIMLFCKTIELDPSCAQAYNNLGLIFKDNGQADKAEACLLKAIEISPYCIHAFYNLAFVYQEGGYLADAEICFRQVLELDAYHTDAYNNLGVLLERVYRLDEAEDCYRKTITLDPKYAAAYFNLGKLLQITNRLAEARHCLYRAAELSPDDKHIHTGIAFFHLSLGEYEEGWEKYYAVLRKNHPSGLISNIPLWHGQSLADRKILLYCEQGLGDTIQFIRYAWQVAALAGEAICLVQKPLQRVLAAALTPITVCSLDEVFSQEYDFSCSLHLLPILFNSDEKNIPSFSSYIHPLPDESNFWRERLAAADGGNTYRVGVVWAGNPRNVMDKYRSIPFSTFSKLFTMNKVSWISLQAGNRADDCKTIPGTLLDVSLELVDFCQTAGIIDNLDLVITMDTSVAHFAGSMGKKTWVLLDSYCDWRWQLDREDSPWYPSVRLFRQKELGDWSEVLERVLAALQQEYLNFHYETVTKQPLR